MNHYQSCKIFTIFNIVFSFYTQQTFGDTHFPVPTFDQIEYHAQASQDKFVYSILYNHAKKEDDGFYLEIGSGDPIEINNTYVLEKDLNWYGVSIDISHYLLNRWNSVRRNPLVIGDATKIDYHSLLQTFPKMIDYLSLDIDGLYDVVLKKLPLDEYTFKVITIEHDFYKYGDMYRKKEREILTSFGYYLICSNVSCRGLTFEDWWVHPSAFSTEDLVSITSLFIEGEDHTEIIKTVENIEKLTIN